MSNDEVISRTDVVIRAFIAKMDVELAGTLEQGSKVSELRGAIAIQKTLSELLDPLLTSLNVDDGHHEKETPQGFLSDLKNLDWLKGIEFETLAVGYSKTTDTPLLQLTLSAVVGGSAKVEDGSRVVFRLIKAFGEGGGVAIGVELHPGSATIGKEKNFLSALIGEVSLRSLAVYYASQELQGVPSIDFEAARSSASLFGSPKTVSRDFLKGPSVFVDLEVGGTPLLPEPAPHPEEPKKLAKAAAPAEEDTSDSTHWIEVDKKVGPVSIRRVGLGFESPRVRIQLDAALQLSVLTFTLDGLGISYPIDQLTLDPKEIWDNLAFHLDGASLTFSKGPLTIAGGLLKVKDDPLQLDGVFLVSTDLFTLTALGSYASLQNGQPSFFLYAVLRADIGGPTFFFVTGLALGLGINRKLTAPPISKVHEFPLVRAAVDPTFAKDLDLRTISKELGQYLAPSLGDYWVAVGVRFTSFEIIESFVLISLAFGTEVVITVLGISKLTLPGPKHGDVAKLVYVELALLVEFRPERGVLKAEAQLTRNSYLFHESCRLSGGFAFYAWFKDTKENGKEIDAGDFVLTVGGYHPNFKPPAHYPLVPRVSLDWSVSDHVKVRGECYFALTSTCLMAGGCLSAVYQDGALRAWFDIYAHFLIAWQPLHYEAKVGVRIGASYSLNIFGVVTSLSFELSAEAEIWGPPFAGRVEIRLPIFSVTVYLGDGKIKELPKLLSWNEFVEKCLPASTSGGPISISVVGGLIPEHEAKKLAAEKEKAPVVNPLQACFVIKSAVPSTTVHSLVLKQGEDKPKLGIRPMGITELSCELKIEFKPISGKHDSETFEIEPIFENVPEALWSPNALEASPKQPKLIKDVCTGVRVRSRRIKLESLESSEISLNDLDLLAKDFDWPASNHGEQVPKCDQSVLQEICRLGLLSKMDGSK